MSQVCPHFWSGRDENCPSRGHIRPTPWQNELNSGQACRACLGSFSPTPRRGCFSDLPGDGIVVSPPSPIVERLPSASIATLAPLVSEPPSNKSNRTAPYASSSISAEPPSTMSRTGSPWNSKPVASCGVSDASDVI